ncbi:MAG TPA: M1 family aminopeptidase [Bryobacteraceae bacterium]|nr:M1 family aminopeptidase [Bryobacteraceae bacterium]
MNFWRISASLLVFSCSVFCQQPTAASLVSALNGLSIDPNEVYHVRDLRLTRGGFTIYLTEGLLAFTKPVGSEVVAAAFTTSGVDAGDAEFIVTPPNRGERASLAYFTKTPNLDEHFSQAIFLFTDQLRMETLRHMQQTEVKKAAADAFGPQWTQTIDQLAAGVEVPIVESMLNRDPPDQGVFYGLIGGNDLGPFQICFNPHQAESNIVGKVTMEGGIPAFQSWTSFLPKKAIAPPLSIFHTAAYQIEADISPDLTVSAVTRFIAKTARENCRAMALEIAPKMKVTGATINGQTVEVVQPQSSDDTGDTDGEKFLLVSAEPLPSGAPLQVEVHHQGSVIHDEGEGIYFVEARNIWFPRFSFDSATFDLTFHCPVRLRIVSSGKLISEKVDGSTRTVHRVLDSPVQFVGFNLGDFVGIEREQSPFRVEFYANRSIVDRINNANSISATHTGDFPAALTAMADRTLELLRNDAAEWGPPPTTNMAVTPIAGTFGQGFPGLIYLSINSYLPPLLRPPHIRDTLLNSFYSDLMLPHEIAHQWWGNLVMANDYRSGWLTEALANYAALGIYSERNGAAAGNKLLAFYRGEIETRMPNGKPVEAEGPLNVGVRLRALNANAWRVITYDKGTWVIRMLAQRLGGNDRFAAFERALIQTTKDEGLSNETFRKIAARFLPPGDPDPTLEYFFDSWVYGVGVPRLSLARSSAREYVLRQSGVGEDFSVDVPVRIERPGRPAAIQWVRSSNDGTPFTVSGTAQVSLPALSDFLYRSE